MPYPSRDPGSNPNVDRGFRCQPNGYFATASLQARTATEAENQRRLRRDGPGEAGVSRPIWKEARNGVPVTAPYVRDATEDADTAAAESAWNQVALIQARLRGEPPPAPIAAPWTRGVCPGCGYRMRCGCPPRRTEVAS